MAEKTEKLENIFRAETLRRSNDGKKKISLRRTKNIWRKQVKCK